MVAKKVFSTTFFGQKQGEKAQLHLTYAPVFFCEKRLEHVLRQIYNALILYGAKQFTAQAPSKGYTSTSTNHEHEKKLLNGPLPRPCTRRNRHYPTAFWSSFLAAASLAALVVYAPAHNFNNPSHPCPFGERRQVWLAVVQPPSQTAYGEICTVSP